MEAMCTGTVYNHQRIKGNVSTNCLLNGGGLKLVNTLIYQGYMG